MDALDAILFAGGTVLPCDGSRREARWAWIERGRVRELGSGPPPAVQAPRYDLAGRVLAPAFCDAHVHLVWLAVSMLGPDLSACDGVEAVLQAVRDWTGAGRGPGGAWIVGHGLDESPWRDRRLPTRADLDRVQDQRPVLLQRACGHVGVLNSLGLEQVPPGPHTHGDTGRVAEDDLYAVNDRLRPDAEALLAVLPRIASTLHAHGITAVHDVTPPELLVALQRARAAGALGVRVSCSVPTRYVNDDLGVPAAGLDLCRLGDGDAFLRVLGLKIFVDGSLGARTAHLRQPYADAPDTRGVALFDRRDLADLARRADAAGLQLMVHAIGDAALDIALDALEPVLAGGNARRHRLEHVEVTPPDLVHRLARSGVRACVQPNFAARWSGPGGMNEQRLGARLQHCNAYRTLARAGVRLAFGSDTMPLGPAFGLQGACAHPLAEERLDPDTALSLYTTSAAELVGAERVHGSIAPGLAADLVVLDADPRRVADWASLRAEAVFLEGRLVHGAWSGAEPEPGAG